MVLRIVQEKKPDTGIFVNIRYEVLEVYNHVPRVKQTGLIPSIGEMGADMK